MIQHISFDLETWGKRAGCDIRSIGACRFDPLTSFIPKNGEIDFIRNDVFYLATINEYWDDGGFCAPGGTMSYPLIKDPETEAWWADQPPEAQAAFENPTELRPALEAFTAFLHLYSEDIKNGQARDIRLWSHGSAFDVPILEAVYHAVGLTVPWFYRAPRDTRTAFDMAGISNHTAHLARFQTGIFHHALDDSISQAHAICDAYIKSLR